MKTVFISALILVSLLGLAKSDIRRTGGFTSQDITPQIKKTIHSIEDKIIATSNDKDVLKVVNDAGNRGKIVHYATQVVAGLNHLIVYRIVPEYDGARIYNCIKVYEDLQGNFSVSKIGSGHTMQELETACDVIISYNADPNTDL